MAKADEVNYPKFRRLLKIDDVYYVPIDHKLFGNLIGSLMQMCDLIGDPEQRKALKDEIKQRGRRWLDDEYQMNGYERWQGVQDESRVTEI